MEQYAQLTIYHTQLKSSVEADLFHQHGKDADAVKMPEVMGPWIQRTILLYGHDDRGRKAFEKNKIGLFPRTLEGMINSSFYWLSLLMIFLFEVILKALQLSNVQEDLSFLVKISQNQEPFHRLLRGRSWELQCFNSDAPADWSAPEKAISEHSRGIFLSGAEKEKTSWKQHLNNKDFHLSLERGNMKNSDLSRLASGKWLNDEIINGYGVLLGKIKIDQLVLNGWFWPSVVNPQKPQIEVVRVLKHQVSTCLFKFSTTVICFVFSPATPKKPSRISEVRTVSVEVHLLPDKL
jgi:hypothetical protein